MYALTAIAEKPMLTVQEYLECFDSVAAKGVVGIGAQVVCLWPAFWEVVEVGDDGVTRHTPTPGLIVCTGTVKQKIVQHATSNTGMTIAAQAGHRFKILFDNTYNLDKVPRPAFVAADREK